MLSSESPRAVSSVKISVSVRSFAVRARNKKCRFTAIMVFALLCQACWGADDGKFEYWSQIGVCAEVNKDWEFELEAELKYGDDASQLYCQNVDFGFVYTGLAEWVDLSFMYKREYETDGEGRWRPENRPHLDVTFKSPLFGFDVSDRSRFEYRDLDAEEDVWRYRNMIKVKLPMEFTKFKLRPYVAEEPFIDFNKGEYNKNRFYLGLYYELSDKIGGALFYLWEARKSGGSWEDFHIFGTKRNILYRLRALGESRSGCLYRY